MTEREGLQEMVRRGGGGGVSEIKLGRTYKKVYSQ